MAIRHAFSLVPLRHRRRNPDTWNRAFGWARTPLLDQVRADRDENEVEARKRGDRASVAPLEGDVLQSSVTLDLEHNCLPARYAAKHGPELLDRFDWRSVETVYDVA